MLLDIKRFKGVTSKSKEINIINEQVKRIENKEITYNDIEYLESLVVVIQEIIDKKLRSDE